MSIRVLLVGSGGREHALAWKLSQSPLVDHIFAVPGNGGTAGLAKVSNVTTVSPDDFSLLVRFAIDENINLLIPGPEAPLVDGITDYFREHGPAKISIFGPSKAAARMEGSKSFSKDFMQRHKIPTAAYNTFTSHAEAQAFIDANKEMNVVIKASGLAAGKGVIIPTSYKEACDALTSIMLDREFGAAGDSVVIEEFLDGEEISVLSFSDGYTIRSLPAAQDHKRINDNDEGPNTGGMGCYAPTAIATPEIIEQIHREVLQPSIDGMRNERFPFVGCLFTGFMMTSQGPKVLEYNVRFGDPESQTLMPLLETDLAEVMLACTNGYLSSIEFKIRPSFSTTVVVAAGGYPGKYAKGVEMTVGQPDDADTVLFHAGTSVDPSTNALSTSGGRVIASTSIGSSITNAVEKAYKGVSHIRFNRMHYRKDIAHRELKRQSSGSKKNNEEALTYASAGVSIEHGNTLVSRIKPHVAATRRPGTDATIGGFGGEIHLERAGYPKGSPTIIAAIDGIGTKILVARAIGNYKTVGIDLVAMNVNDLIVQGAEPLAFLDYYACSKLDVDAATDFVIGVAEGCKMSNCGLIGGETAEMPDLYQVGDFDGAGCAIGALATDRTMLPDMESMKEGDVLVGLASSGCHSNGFSLIRKIVERSGLKYGDAAPWASSQTVGEALLTPTRIYVTPLLNVLGRKYGGDRGGKIGAVSGMSHITGGGLHENIPRMLPKHLAAEMDVGSWPVPEVFKWLKAQGKMAHEEFATTFNTGLGMVLVVGAADVQEVMEQLKQEGEAVYEVGRLVKRLADGRGCALKNIEKWDAL